MRLLRTIKTRIRYGGSVEMRTRRYILTGILGCGLAWGLSLSYLLLSPKGYSSSFVLILPGTGAGSSLNLPTLGQATSTSASAFASPELSPTENYRKMLLSDRALRMAADAAGEEPDHFPPPKVELADQTKLISVKIGGRSPEQAARRAESVRSAFLTMLDSLRTDELQTRDAAYRDMLVGYKTAVNEARQRLMDYEAKTGLVSVEQYSAIVAAVEHLREALRDTETRLANLRAGIAELVRQLGVTPEQANIAMALRSDPFFQALLEQLAKQDTELAVVLATHGPNAPKAADLGAERAGVAAKLAMRAAELTGSKRLDVLKLRDLNIHDERARLFERLVGQIADAEALAATRAKLAEQIDSEHTRVMALAPAASRLDDLKRDVQVSEAVFSSALARIDTSKSDYFSSYPMLQTLEPPSLPIKPTSPQPLLAVAGGLGASFFLLASLVLTWLRTALLQKILKNA